MEEGMQRRERRGSNHYYLRSKQQLFSSLGTDTEEEDEKEIYKPNRRNKCRKKRKTMSNDGSRPWGDLPIDLLFSIANMLQIVDLFNFGKVCKQWRSCFSTYKQNFVSKLPPLVMYTTYNDDRSCHFYDISTGSKYRTELPTLVRTRFCIGCSSGYLILGDTHYNGNVWVINPLTGHELHFTNMPHSLIPDGYFRDCAIFASFGSGSDFALILFSKRHICYCISRDTSSWMSLFFVEEIWDIVDMVVFDGRVFVLNDHLRIGVLNLTTQKLSFLTHGGTPFSKPWHAWLVASKKQLLRVDINIPLVRVTVHAIDFARMKWVEVKDLGDEALFLDFCKSSKIGSTSNWKGLKNCAYCLPYQSSLCYIDDINEYRRDYFSIILPFATRTGCRWYSLHEAYSPDNIKDED